MEKIIVHDHFFLESDIDKIDKTFLYINYNTNNKNKKLNKLEITDIPFWRVELSENTLFNKYLKEIIEQKMNKNFNLKRVYAVAQTYEENSNYHPDEIGTNSYTFCFYLNKYINENDCGYFYIKIPNSKQILAIEPIRNRGVIFPASYIHRGTGCNRFSDQLRICIAWKFVEII
jgi:hypothetical protein